VSPSALYSSGPRHGPDATEPPPFQNAGGKVRRIGSAAGFTFWRSDDGYFGITRSPEVPPLRCNHRSLDLFLAYHNISRRNLPYSVLAEMRGPPPTEEPRKAHGADVSSRDVTYPQATRREVSVRQRGHEVYAQAEVELLDPWDPRARRFTWGPGHRARGQTPGSIRPNTSMAANDLASASMEASTAPNTPVVEVSVRVQVAGQPPQDFKLKGPGHQSAL